jgi:hypothetical protein
MNENDRDDDERSRAELRLHEHLDVLRQDAPDAPLDLARRIVRTVRWQRAVRRPLLAIGALTATVGHALRLLLKPPAGHP